MNLSMSNTTNMTSIVNKLYPHFKSLEDELGGALKDSLFDKIEDKLYIQLYSAPNDSVEFDLSYE